MLPAPIRPNPPALLTAEASLQPLHQTIPPCIMGYLMPNSLFILLVMYLFFLCLVANSHRFQVVCPAVKVGYKFRKILDNVIFELYQGENSCWISE
jgi:hypothetical protein